MSDLKYFALYLLMVFMFGGGMWLGAVAGEAMSTVATVIICVAIFMLVLVGMYAWGKASK